VLRATVVRPAIHPHTMSSPERFTYPPLVAHGPDNKGATVVVVSLSFMFITILFSILRAWSSYMQKREYRWDDIAFIIAVVRNIPFSDRSSDLTDSLLLPGLGHSRDRAH
jgi:hypothetical protein